VTHTRLSIEPSTNNYINFYAYEWNVEEKWKGIIGNSLWRVELSHDRWRHVT